MPCVTLYSAIELLIWEVSASLVASLASCILLAGLMAIITAAARMARMAITIRSSINVKPALTKYLTLPTIPVYTKKAGGGNKGKN